MGNYLISFSFTTTRSSSATVIGTTPTSEIEAVKFWLDERQAERDAERSDQQHTMAKQSAFWTRTRCMVAVVCSVAVLLMHWIATH